MESKDGSYCRSSRDHADYGDLSVVVLVARVSEKARGGYVLPKGEQSGGRLKWGNKCLLQE